MSYKSLLVHVDTSDQAITRVNLAIWLANTFEAHLTGLSVAATPMLMAGSEGGAIEDLYTSACDHLKQCAEDAHRTFDQLVARAGLESFEWREYIGHPVADTNLNAHYQDLVIVGQPEHALLVSGLTADYPEAVALNCGRPVLIVPSSGQFDQVGSNVLVAWNAKPEAARAVTNALPLLRRAQRVTLLIINPDVGPEGHGEAPGHDIALYLSRHGVPVEVMSQTVTDEKAGHVLLTCANDLGADLIVMGVYGHSYLRELLLGGVSRTLMSSMTVPVLVSH